MEMASDLVNLLRWGGNRYSPAQFRCRVQALERNLGPDWLGDKCAVSECGAVLKGGELIYRNNTELIAPGLCTPVPDPRDWMHSTISKTIAKFFSRRRHFGLLPSTFNLASKHGYLLVEAKEIEAD